VPDKPGVAPGSGKQDLNEPDQGNTDAPQDSKVADLPAPDLPAPELPPLDLPPPDAAMADQGQPDAAPPPKPITGACTKDKWCWMNPLPQGHTLNAVWTDGAQVFAVGEAGTLLHHDGKQWSPMDSGTIKALYGVWGSSPSDLCATGEGGILLCFDGKTRLSYTAGAGKDLHALWGTASNNIYAVGMSGTIAHNAGSGFVTEASGTLSHLNAA